MRILLFILFALSFKSAFALYGDVMPRKNLYPFVVDIILHDSEHPEVTRFCSGVLITPKKVLTAGHCIDALGLELYEYGAALEHDPEKVGVKIAGIEVHVSRITESPLYHEASDARGEDLAIIELQTPITHVKPIPLASLSELTQGMDVKLVSRSLVAKTKLLAVKGSTVSKALITNGRLAGTCMGDSGGALIIEKNGQLKLAGILGYSGEGACEKKHSISFFPRARF